MNKANDDSKATSSNNVSSDSALDPNAVVVRPSSPFWALVEYRYELEKLEYLCGDLHVGAYDHGGDVTALSPALRARLKELPENLGALPANLDQD